MEGAVHPAHEGHEHRPAHGSRGIVRLLPVIVVAALLLSVTLYAFLVRDQPAKYGELQGLDDFYLYRVSEYSLQHGLQLPVPDYYRNYPFGTHPEFDQPLPFLMAPAMFLLLGSPGHFLHFAIHWPAIGGAVGVFFLFFLARELGIAAFRKRKEKGSGHRWLPEIAGLFAALLAAATPAFINRTGAGNYEKEGTAAFFLTLMVWLFVRAYLRRDWRCAVLGGVALMGLIWSWGGSAYFVILMAVFSLVALLVGEDAKRLLLSYGPVVLIGIFVPWLAYSQHLDPEGTPGIVALGTLALIGVRYAAQRWKLVKEKQLPWLVPGLVALGLLVLVGGWSFGLDPIASQVDSLLSTLSLTPGVELSTVAESQPGGWGDVVARTAADLANGPLPWLSPVTGYFALWGLALLGIIVLAYLAAPTKPGLFALVALLLVAGMLIAFSQVPANGTPIHAALAPAALLVLLFAGMAWKGEKWPLLPLLWYVSAVFGVLGFIRLLFLVGLPSAVLAGLFCAWLIGNAQQLGSRLPKLLHFVTVRVRGFEFPIHLLTVLAGVFVFLLVLIHGNVGMVYGSYEGPSICFAQNLNGQPCITFDSEGNEVYASGQPWYEAMEFLAKSTPPSGNVLSWWDFGYWFQTRGKRPSPTDGGFGIRDEVADWFLTPTDQWEEWVPWLDDRYHVQTILMDYSLPGKFGAISKISLRDRIIGIAQFSQIGNFAQDNVTIFEYGAGENRVWIPVAASGAIAGSPQLLLSNGQQYQPQAYINDMCTSSGIVRLGEQQPELAGCLANTPYGLFFVPGEVERSIFTSLMFMDGYGLPVDKTFDNTLVKMYQVRGATGANVTVDY